MKVPMYISGEEVRPGDRILFHGETGEVEFVVTHLTGDASMDWYLEQHPEGGLMLTASGLGSVFVATNMIDERLKFVSRSNNSAM